MAKSNSFNKREIEKQKQQKRKEKQQRKEARKNSPKDSFDDMIAYVDANGNLCDTPPCPTEKVEVNLEDIHVSTPPMEDREDPISKGRIEFFNSDKGFGFIKDAASVEKYFFHISNAPEDIREGDKVTFELERGKKGMNAINITLQNK